ncbi:MAG: 2OG-Fe(II) oxygenase [Actinomycetota bacterium]|nr:2OG-Fe(II) oxygenase [Actinomycetota bacterium]
MLIDLDAFADEAGSSGLAYRHAKPFPYVVVDNVLHLEPDAAEPFPEPEWDGWRALGDAYQSKKFVCDDIERIPRPFSTLIDELSRPRVLRLLEKLTGIEGLLPDPYLTGGGLHLSGPGGILAPHTDFHFYLRVGLYRRVNLILYLNEAWTEADGGCLEMWDDDHGTERHVIVPKWARCVIFTTDDQSIHGFPVPIAEGKWRRSLALYYYTAVEAATFSGDSTTYWRAHGRKTGMSRARLGLYRALIQGSRSLSILAQFANPNQGPRAWLRARQHGSSELDR